MISTRFKSKLPNALSYPLGAQSDQRVAGRTVGRYLMQIAKLGGYLARAKDPSPGIMVIWRGLARLTDMLLGFGLQNDGCG